MGKVKRDSNPLNDYADGYRAGIRKAVRLFREGNFKGVFELLRGKRRKK